METNWNQSIERYLNGELSAEGKAGFETELAKNPELKQEFELHKLTQEVIKRASTRNMVQQSAKSYHFKKMVTNTGIIVLIVAVITTAVLLFTNSGSNSENPNSETEELIEQSLLEEMNKDLQFENIDPQYFKFTGKNDVFLSESGVLLSITNESFLLNGKSYKGTAIVQWQEAQKASEIIKAGLSTMSGNKLLETQGMFSLNAFTPDGKQLELSKEGIYVQVPVDELKKDMMLFNGVKGKSGNIDWQSPVELERLPKPKSMAKMDLFPPKYEPKLNELKWFTTKAKRDSLYLSFDENFGVTEKDTFISHNGSNTIEVPKQTNTKPQEPLISTAPFTDITLNAITGSTSETGKKLYEAKCATCHNLNRDGTGPNLSGVRQRWADGGAKEGSLYKWVSNSAEAVALDPYAAEIASTRPSIMARFPELNGKQELIDAIFDYIDSQPSYPVDTVSHKQHIPPSKVLAIWNKKFDNTILATQDFEDRMKAIHNTCDERVFDVYVNNLNEPLWKLDERVVKMGYPEFREFADQKVGCVKIKDDHQNNLQDFYEKALKTIQSAGKKNVEAALKKEHQWDEEVQDGRQKEVMRKGLRESTNLNEEYGFNLQNVYKQLGNTVAFQMHGGGTIVNIDKYVWDATVARQSTLITDPNTGKTAQITYNPMKLEVKDAQKYNRLYVYLFSTEINSYQRLDFKNGKLNYNLNGDMNYTAAIIGINEDGYFFQELGRIKAEDLGVFSLKKISAQEFDKRINAMNNKRMDKPMELKDELSWLFKEQANYVVQKKRHEDAAFRNTIRPTIYSCGMSEMDERDYLQ